MGADFGTSSRYSWIPRWVVRRRRLVATAMSVLLIATLHGSVPVQAAQPSLNGARPAAPSIPRFTASQAPTDVRGMPEDGRAQVSWKAPGVTGGRPVTA
jgi:hypothetical protein